MFCPQCGQQLAGARTAGVATPDATAAERLTTNDGHAHPVPEEELWTGAYSLKAMAGTVAGVMLAIILGAIAASVAGPIGWIVWVASSIAIWIWMAIMFFYRRVAVRYRLTSYRFFTETGVLARTNNRIQAIDIDDVTVAQGPIERLLGVGTIVIRARDETNPVLTLRGIEDAPRVADMIDGARRAERNRRGLYVAEM